MKITIFLIIALFTIAHAEPACDLDSMCMGCDASVSDKCTACYNGTNATYGARYIKTDACANKLTLMTDCTVYYPNNTDATITDTTTLVPPCWQCASGKQLKIATTTDPNPRNASEIVGTLGGTWSCDTAAVSDSTLVGCAVKMNIQGTTTANVEDACFITSAGYCRISTNTIIQTSTVMTDTGCSAFANCSNTMNTFESGTLAQVCHNAADGYAVKSDGSAGIAFTTDTNCRKLLDATNCGTCNDGYWFGGAKCYMKSSMIFLSAIAFFAAWFF